MSETKKTKKPAKKHIIDVEEPGTSAPSATSKPVIVTNRPILKDPMMVDGKEEVTAKPAEPAPTSIGSSGKPKLEPLSAPVLLDQDAQKASKKEIKTSKKGAAQAEKPEETAISPDPEVSKPAESEPKPLDNAATEPAAKDEETHEETGEKAASKNEAAAPVSEDAKVPDQNDDKGAKTEKKLEAEAAEQAKHEAEVQKLVESKKYELPINAVEKRKTKRFIMLGIFLAILLALAWGDIAADAGIIHVNGIKPVTHFFSN